MNQFAIPIPERPSVAIHGSSVRFPLRRVFCVGRNYAAHAREMGNDPDREPPFFFMKPADAVVPAEGVVPYPTLTSEFHHEVELVVALGQGGRSVSVAEALQMVWGYGIGVDLTRRDLQDAAKKSSRPWDWAKGFDASAPCSALRPVSDVGHPASGEIWLDVNDERRQTGTLEEMIWPIADVISYLSKGVLLLPGDLIFSGTPAGVGPMQAGDRVTCGISGIGQVAFSIGTKPQ